MLYIYTYIYISAVRRIFFEGGTCIYSVELKGPYGFGRCPKNF